jgi:hypothetical protein
VASLAGSALLAASVTGVLQIGVAPAGTGISMQDRMLVPGPA